ncbi:MAG: NAD-dependent epimerase/dehydratase family protein [Phycisphaeraceae bacterium]
MRILYIGGTGEISYSCIQESARAGQRVTIFNRGKSSEPLPDTVERITGDLTNDADYARLGEQTWDVVCQFKAYDLKVVQRDLATFAGKCGQYLFISSASAYQKPPAGKPNAHIITEATPLENPYWPYSNAKKETEAQLMQWHESGKLPVTIVRPSHTYRRNFPSTIMSGDELAWRIEQGKSIIVHGDGTSLWVVTHSDDFAVPFVKLLGDKRALGQAFHITSDDVWSWNQIITAIGAALDHEPRMVHVPTATLCRYNPNWTGPLWGDKSHCVAFDNSKVKQIAPQWRCQVSMPQGMKRVAESYRQRAAAFVPKAPMQELMDRIAEEQTRLGA